MKKNNMDREIKKSNLSESHIIILSEPFYNFIYWDNGFHALGMNWTRDLGKIWTLSKSSQSVQFLSEKCPNPA